MIDSRPDHWRRTRWAIARLIILVDLLMALGPVFVVYRLVTGQPSELTSDQVLLVAWALALGPLAASFVLALRVFKARDRAREWRVTGWASGLFLFGVLIIGVTSAIRDNH
jgi:hypothetical protein